MTLFSCGWSRTIVIVGMMALPSIALAQLRVATWNISNYGGGRVSDIQTAVYGEYNGRSFSPDVILTQEFLSTSAANAFRNALNTAPGSPGDWEIVYVGGPDTGCAFAYRTSKIFYYSYSVISSGGAYPSPPRNTVRFNALLQGYSSDEAFIGFYNSHMKAGSSSQDGQRRLTEATRIRDNAESLISFNADRHFLLGADLNIQSSGESAYQALVGSQANNDGRFYDPINTPGSWNNSYSYRYVHTQDPIGPGGMDDRYDQILVSGNLIDGEGVDYIGDASLPYASSFWNDPNHSYRCWGNDGSSYNDTLTTFGNSMVGSSIAVALRNVCSGAGHLPVYLDLQVPAEIDSTPVLDFGQVNQGDAAALVLEVWNAGDVALWTAEAIDELDYTLDASSGFDAPSGSFVHLAGDAPNQHIVTMDTSAPGTLNGTLTIHSDAPDEPERQVTLVGEVVEAVLLGDMNCDGVVDFGDINPFVVALTGPIFYDEDYPDCRWLNGDINEDGDVDFDDINPFVSVLAG